MSASPIARRALWLLPIVIAVCAVMILPGGTFVASGAHAGNAMASAAGIVPEASNSPATSIGHIGPTTSTGANYGSSVAAPSGGLTPSSPSAPTGATSHDTSLLTSLPAYLDHTVWAQALLHPSATVKPTTSLPNLQILQDGGVTPVNGQISPFYLAQPAPLGIADYGLGVNTYSYNTSFMAGSVTFNTPPNATQPGGGPNFVEPSAGGEHQGALGNIYEFGIQLNTVGINLSIPGTNDQGYVWAQNVVNWNDTGIHFVMDTWNASLDSEFYMAPNSIYSACDNNTLGVNNILSTYGGVLQCVKGTIPIAPADYPITITLYNNFTTNAQNRTQLVYGYSITEAGAGKTLSGIADTVVFNNTSPNWMNPTKPANLPGNAIDGFTSGPKLCPTCGGGITLDSEIDLVGGIGGDNAVFQSINGSMTLQYKNLSGPWQNVPSAYNFGGDTGETSTGIADYYTAGHTLEINQGPAMLYGLWGAEKQVAVGPGDVHIGGSITPNYGFVFVSNTPPVLNPWSGTVQDNMSYLPTNNAGVFNTYLPAFGGTWTTTYYVQAFAAGATEYNGTVTGSTSALTINLAASPHTLRAPLYMYTNAQASALAAAVGGSASSPYTFNNLEFIDVNFTFDHLNDYHYPSFEVFQALGIGNPVYVNNTYLGTDSATSGNSYIYDTSLTGPTGILTPIPSVFTDIPYYTSGINIYNGVDDHVTNQEIFDVQGQGSQIVLWEDSHAWVNDTISVDGGPGVWVGNSLDTEVANTFVVDSTGVSDVGSTGTLVWNLTVYFGEGISALSSHHATYDWINASIDSLGIDAGADYGPGTSFYYDLPGADGTTVNELNVTEDAIGGNFTFSSTLTFTNVLVWDPFTGYGYGLDLDGVYQTTITNMVANWGGALTTWNVTDLTINGLLFENESEYYITSNIDDSTNVVINGLVVDDSWDVEYGYGTGIWGILDTNVVLNSPLVENQFGGVVFQSTNGITATDPSSTDSTFPYQFGPDSTNITVTNDNTYLDYIGINIYESTNATVSNAIVNDSGLGSYDYAAGVAFYDSSASSLTGVTVTNSSWGARLDFGTTTTAVSTVAVASGSVGVWIESANDNTVTGVTVVGPDSWGVEVDPSAHDSVSTVTVTDEAVGVGVADSTYISVQSVTATDESIAVVAEDSTWTTVSSVTVTDLSVGVFSIDSDWTTTSGVTASNSTLTSTWYQTFFGLPITAVFIEDDAYDSISNITATTYGAAMVAYESYDLGVNDVNATSGQFAIVLNDTAYSTFTDIGAFHDWVGIQMSEDASYNVITMSSFVDCTSYGVSIYYGYYNLVYENNFIADNGATGTYSSAHIQAYSGYGDYNYFDADSIGLDEGNYWSDWHTYNQYGTLAPYPIGDGNFDYYPIGGPEGSVSVYFYEDGLASGVTWSMTFKGVTQSTANDWMVFYVFAGTYSFATGAVTGYSVAPATGSVQAIGGYNEVDVTYTALYNVTVTESGLPTGTMWTATVGGISVNGTTASLSVALGSGTYAYQITSVAGYTASPSSGMVTVGTMGYNVVVTFTQVKFAVTVTENGLSSGQSWTVTLSSTAPSYTSTQSSTGTSVTFYVPNGTYQVTVTNVSGYSLAGAHGSVLVAGGPVGYSATFTTNSSPSVVSTDTFNTWLGVAIAIAVIAVVIGLLAVFLRRRPDNPSGGQPGTPSNNPSSNPPDGGAPPS